jgi:hypothetical protein
MLVTKDGIQSVQDGNITVHQYFMNLNVQLYSVHETKRIEYDEKNRAFLKRGADDKPIIRNGQYVPCTYDDWIVLSVVHTERWIGLPSIH